MCDMKVLRFSPPLRILATVFSWGGIGDEALEVNHNCVQEFPSLVRVKRGAARKTAVDAASAATTESGGAEERGCFH